MSEKHYHEANRKSWNEATKVHNSHKGDQAAFLANGGSTLFPEETRLLGDIKGLSLLHLQCNSGQDTLSIASHLGAKVTGVDISDEAVDFATRLSAESGIPAVFHRADVYDWLGQADEQQFDVVFSSYGVIGWLSDLSTWAKGIKKVLKSGGRFVLVEFHPLPMIYERDWTLSFDYMGGEMLPNEYGVGDYVAESGGGLTHTGEKIEGAPHFENPHAAYEFCWGLSDVITALLEVGMQLKTFTEYSYSNGWKPFPNMRELADRRMVLPEEMPTLPFMFGVVVLKP